MWVCVCATLGDWNTHAGTSKYKYTHTLLYTVYLEPVDGAAVDERGEHADPVPEGISNGAHGQHHVELLSHSIYKEVEEGQRCAVSLLRLLSLPDMRGGDGEREKGREG